MNVCCCCLVHFVSADPCCPRNLCLLPWLNAAVFDFLGLCLPLCIGTTSPGNPFLKPVYFCPVLWQLSINPQLNGSHTRKYLLTCRKCPLFLDYRKRWGSACCQPPIILLPVFFYLLNLYFVLISLTFFFNYGTILPDNTASSVSPSL